METLADFIAGCGAGIIGVIVGHPMDTIKTKQQVSFSRALSTREVIRVIAKKEGLAGFYKGMLFPLLSSGTLNSVFFGVYAVCLKTMQAERGNDPLHISPTSTGFYQDNFIAGSLGGIGQAFISCPSELIKIRMQIGQGVFKNDKGSTKRLSSYYTTKDLYRKHGLRGLFLGFTPTLLRDFAANGIYIVSYHYFRYNLYGQLNLEPGAIEILVAGGIAGIFSWLPVIPLDTIKSRIQADDFKNPKYKGMFDCGARLLQHEGLSGFFKGSFMITLRSIPVNAAIFYGYNIILWFLVPQM